MSIKTITAIAMMLIMYKARTVATAMKTKVCIPKIKQIRCVLGIGFSCTPTCFLIPRWCCFMNGFKLQEQNLCRA
jgi:hypothetical protein